MALLMRRLFIDAQAKLRRMVEENSMNLTTRIDSECSAASMPSSDQAATPATIAYAPSSSNDSSDIASVVNSTNNTQSPQARQQQQKQLDDTEQQQRNITDDSVKTTNTTTSNLIVNDKTSDLTKNLLNNTSYSNSRPNLIDGKKFKDKLSYSFDSSNENTDIDKPLKTACDFKTFKSSSVDSSASANSAHGGGLNNNTIINGDLKNNLVNNTNSETIDVKMTCPESEQNNCTATVAPENKDVTRNNSGKQITPESPQPGCSSTSNNQQQQQLELTSMFLSSSSSSSKSKSIDTSSSLLSSFASKGSNLSNNNGTVSAAAARRLRLENERLQAEITRLRRLVVSGVSKHEVSVTDGNTENEDSPGRLQPLEIELQLAREAIATLKTDRKRLKAEKFDLLNQMKQLYATLEDKEKELRDFIRNYEQRMRDSETSLQQLNNEREERERERWSLLRHARDEAERSLSLAAQLNAKELQLQQAQEQLQEARRQLAASGCLSDQESLPSLPRHSINGGSLTPGSGGLLSSGQHGLGFGSLAGDRGSCSADSGVRVSSDRESGGATSAGGNLSDSTTDGTPTITVEGTNIDVDTISVVSSIAPHMYQLATPKDCSPTLSPLNANAFTRSMDSGVLSRSVEQLSSPLDIEPTSGAGRRMKVPHSRPGSGSRGGTWGSISRVFARSRHRNKLSNSTPENELAFDPYRSWSPLTEEGYAEKLRLLREAASIPMERWRAPTVLAWIEIALGMPQYGARCAENVKSGKVLLELSDLELECGLGITHPMHRKKLRLAIEEHRNPNLVRYPCISQLGHTWVSSEWLPDLGLAQYAENFATNMVDARMLDQLSKKELEKFLGVTRKFHQASIVHGIHLLRIMKYDRQALAVRRHQCESVDADPLVWTNQRFIRWARNIDLGEYSENLKDSGVHGGLVVLEPSFNGDTMATALGIPPSKNMIRRHLIAELEALILPARSTLEHFIRVRSAGASKQQRVPGGSLGRSFSRSCGGNLAAPSLPPTTNTGSSNQESESRRSSLRGSLSRAFGLMKGDRDKQSPTSSSETSSIVSRISPPPSYPYSRGYAHSAGESPIYATPFNIRHSGGFINNLISENDDEIYETNHYQKIGTNKDFLDNIIDTPTKTNTTTVSTENCCYASPKIEKSSFKNNFLANSLHRGKKNHRRVKSIGDIDSITAVSSPV
ncbi:kazrin isoform X2 [Chrysoperla carnea]|uniref:kazrin isoform X2 n=1 Tax=Chrysoperla carnea TaxID=189513 RepID=UPI001D09763B|nr:kazrin isoform X2 [Chrysoperla carnea]